RLAFESGQTHSVLRSNPISNLQGWLARKRRKLSNAVVAQRAGISRTSLYKVERGDPGATLGTYQN
ncbi:MAG: helix-turn-helix domain-containing protein, partial [Comamonadaceae bacterium]